MVTTAGVAVVSSKINQSASIRESPANIEGNILKELPNGSRVRILDSTSHIFWSTIEDEEGVRGYIEKQDLVDEKLALSGFDVASSALVQAPGDFNAANLRSSPSNFNEDNILIAIRNGQAVKRLLVKPEGDWVKIGVVLNEGSTKQYYEGWVHKNFLH
jgi:hypothetical protein